MSGWFRSRWRVLPIAVRIVGLQTAAALATALILGLLTGSFQPALTGGACAVLPNAWMAWRVRNRPGRDPAGEAWRTLLGAFEKLLLTGGLLAWALLRLNDLSAPAFFAGFIVALAAHHAALVIVTREGREA
ncbi:MAG: ATP synthase subunit I [Gammaproteobacteria bacterium]|nr:ATP synthase subunit I [Gammaproteobacteria bacterium]